MKQHHWPPLWLCTVLLTAAIYAASPLHHLRGGDSGELMAEACVNGVAHPPGYPLLLSLLKMSQWLVQRAERQAQWLLVHNGDSEPLEQIPFVVVANALNAGFAVGAAACVTQVVDLWSRREFFVEAITAGLVFATSKLTWEYAIGLEVFALNNLLVGVLHVLVARHFLRPSARNAYAAAFVCGLGLANQHTISTSSLQSVRADLSITHDIGLVFAVLFEIPFVAAALLTRHLGLREIVSCALWFAAGISIYVQTFAAAQTPTLGSWGDASTLSGLWKHVIRQEYGTFRLSPLQNAESEGFLARLQLYLLDTVDEFTCAGVAFASIGVFCAAMWCLPTHRQTPKVSANLPLHQHGRTLLAAMTVYLVVFHALANIPLGDSLARAVSSRFSIQPNTIVAIWLGIGLVVCAHWLGLHSRSKLLVQAFRYGVCGSLVTHQLNSGFRDLYHEHWREDVIRSYGEQILSSLPENALLLSYTDIQWNTIRYLQLCEGQRRDVTHLSLQLMAFPWFRSRQQELYTANQIQFPVIRSDVSTIRTSRGYTKYLREFLVTNLLVYKDRLFLDLHGVNDGDIGEDGAYHGVSLSPHGAVWQVHYDTVGDALYERWAQAPWANQDELSVGPESVNPHAFAKGSWEFAALTISNDGEYQRGLFGLSHWLSKAKRITRLEQLVEFVHGLWGTTQGLEQVVAREASTYPAFDVCKNAAVARMRFHTGLEVLVSVVSEENQSVATRNLQSNKLFMDLKGRGVLSKVQEARARALEVIDDLLPELRARSDPHLDAFLEFVEQHTTTSNKNNIVASGDLQQASTERQQATEKQPTANRKKRKRRSKATATKMSKQSS